MIAIRGFFFDENQSFRFSSSQFQPFKTRTYPNNAVQYLTKLIFSLVFPLNSVGNSIPIDYSPMVLNVFLRIVGGSEQIIICQLLHFLRQWMLVSFNKVHSSLFNAKISVRIRVIVFDKCLMQCSNSACSSLLFPKRIIAEISRLMIE